MNNIINDDYLNSKQLTTFFNKIKTLFATKDDIQELRGEDGISIASVEQTTSSSADGGTNVITVTLSDGSTSSFNIKNGSKGSSGTAAGFGTPTATVDTNVGTPSVTVTASGSNTAKIFNFAFKNLKGAKGDKGATGTRGSMIYWGAAITGTSTTATVFSGSGVSSALVNDLYINTSTWNIYQCTTAGATSVAKWTYKGNIKGATGAKGAAGTNATTTAIATTTANGLMSKEMVQKLGSIDGITDSLTSTSSTIAASAKAVSTLNSNLSDLFTTKVISKNVVTVGPSGNYISFTIPAVSGYKPLLISGVSLPANVGLNYLGINGNVANVNCYGHVDNPAVACSITVLYVKTL